MQPLSIVESRAFRSVLEKAEPRYTMASRKHLSSKLLTARYSEVRSSVEHLLHLAPQICLTVDIWSNRQMKSYLGVTGHFIIDFTLHSVMLSCRQFRASHTGEEILGYFLDIKDSFNISGKVKNIITDNASNMKKAFRLLETQVDEDDNEDEEGDDTLQPVELTEELDLLPTHHPCFSHMIQLVVKDGLDNADQVKRVLGKITRLVSHVHHSTKASDVFEDDLKLQMANATRWNSQLTMIKSLLRVSNSTMEKLDYNGKLNAYEINIAKDLVEILTPFKWLTDLSQGENQVTASIILPVIRGLQAELKHLDEKFKSRLVTTLKSSANARLSQFEEDKEFKLAAALDPRWKLAWCTPEEQTDLKQAVLQKAEAMSASFSSSTMSSQGSDSPPKKRSKHFQFMKDNPRREIPSGTCSLFSQIEEYFSSPCIPEDADPLIYWKHHQLSYPILSKLACHFLQVPASSAPVERRFSIAGKIFRPERCLLRDELFEKLMFIRCNSYCS